MTDEDEVMDELVNKYAKEWSDNMGDYLMIAISEAIRRTECYE